MIKKYVITISEELYNKLPDYAKNSVFWAYRYHFETKTVSYATVCGEETFNILKPLLEYLVEKENYEKRKG